MFLKAFFSSVILVHVLFPAIMVLTIFSLVLIFLHSFLSSYVILLFPFINLSLLPYFLLMYDLPLSLPYSHLPCPDTLSSFPSHTFLVLTHCIPQLVDYFTDGQHCDETEGTRSTDVHIQCCTGLHVNSPNKDIVTSVTQRNQPHARLNGNPNPPVINEVHTL